MNTVDLRVGWRCDQRCVFCDQATRRDDAGEPDASTEAVIAAMPQTDAIWLAGGEITLRSDLPRLIAAAKGARRIGLQTNGRILAAPGAAAGLRKMGVTDVAIALHAPTATLHDHLAGVAGFKKTLLGIKAAVAAGLVTKLHTVVTRSLDFPELARLAQALGVRGHRWILAREEGPTDPRGWAPRLARIAGPLQAAVQAEWDAGLEAEVVGVPLCFLGPVRAAAADRRDVPAARRVAPPGFEDPERSRTFGAPCEGCTMRPACPGVEAAYATRWGWEEVGTAIGTPAPASPLTALHVDAPCTVGCAGCPAGSFTPKSGRTLRQELVQASVAGATGVAFVGGSPWSHPELPKLLGEAARLGLRDIEVWGPVASISAIEDRGRLSPLTKLRIPRIPELEAGVEGAVAAVHTVAPSCAVERYAAAPACVP